MVKPQQHVEDITEKVSDTMLLNTHMWLASHWPMSVLIIYKIYFRFYSVCSETSTCSNTIIRKVEAVYYRNNLYYQRHFHLGFTFQNNKKQHPCLVYSSSHQISKHGQHMACPGGLAKTTSRCNESVPTYWKRCVCSMLVYGNVIAKEFPCAGK